MNMSNDTVINLQITTTMWSNGVPNSSETPSNFIANTNNSHINATESSKVVNDPIVLSAVIPLTVIYIIIFVSGIVGNIITCVVISRNRSMHTATNYYLFSLAISDLLVLIAGLPLEVFNTWNGLNMYAFSYKVCVIQNWLCEVSANASVLTITAFTIERYIAICKPFLSHTMSKLSRAVKIILGIWAFAVCLAIPAAMELGIVDEGTTRYCTVINAKNAANTFTISVIVVFILPMIVISILYILIGLQLRRSKIIKRGGTSGSSVKLKHCILRKPSQRAIVQVDLQNDKIPISEAPSSANLQYTLVPSNKQGNSIVGTPTRSCINNEAHSISSEDGRINFSNRNPSHGTRHVINMLVAVVVAFFICWGLFHTQRLFSVYYTAYFQETQIPKFVRNLYDTLTWISGIFYYVSTCVNPFLYNIMSRKFRMAFKDTIANYFYGGGDQQPQLKRKRWCIRHRNSFHSQSFNNTCSTIVSNHQQTTRYINGDMRKLKRPLVVSFRKIPRQSSQASSSHSSSQIIELDHRTNIIESDLSESYPLHFKLHEINDTILSEEPNIAFHHDCAYYSRYKNNYQFKLIGTNEIDTFDKNIPKYGHLQLHYNPYESKHISKLQKKSKENIPVSPYVSPEMTYNTKLFERNLNHILEDLVLKDDVYSDRIKRRHKKWYHAAHEPYNLISKSKSVPSFLSSTHY